MTNQGRPTDYKPEYAEQAKKLCELGATDDQLADFFDVCVRTIYRWKASQDAFSQALKIGKEEADNRVERSLYQKAVGYEREAVKIFFRAGDKNPVYAPYTEYYPPDTTAGIFWLKNRKSLEWRDRKEIDHRVSPEDVADRTDAELLAVINKARAGGKGASKAKAGKSKPDKVH